MCILSISDEDMFLAPKFHQLLSTYQNLQKYLTGDIASLHNVTMAHFLKFNFQTLHTGPTLISASQSHNRSLRAYHAA